MSTPYPRYAHITPDPETVPPPPPEKDPPPEDKPEPEIPPIEEPNPPEPPMKAGLCAPAYRPPAALDGTLY